MREGGVMRMVRAVSGAGCLRLVMCVCACARTRRLLGHVRAARARPGAGGEIRELSDGSEVHVGDAPVLEGENVARMRVSVEEPKL